MFFSCCSRQKTAAQNNTPEDLSSAELPLPDVPKNLTAPQGRAEYIMKHFWDGMDFTDTLRSHNRDFMELNFVNFISLFPHAAEETLPQAINILLDQSAADSTAFNIITDFAEKYLYDTGSPMRNEDYYMMFLEGLLHMPNLSEEYRIRPAGQLETAMKNRPGMTAADFAYTTREGSKSTLHATQSDILLLVFYDPACSHCTEILTSLEENPLLSSLIDTNCLSVLAIYTEGDRELWDDTKSSMPETWTIGIDESDIVNHAIYNLPAMPIIYLLDKDKTVLLKDPTPVQLTEYLSRLQ